MSNQIEKVFRRFSLLDLLNNFQRAIAIHGITGSVKISLQSVYRLVARYTPAGRRSRLREIEFDRKWGTDTGGIIIPGKADVVGPHWKYGVRYEACNDSALYQVLRNLDIEYEDFTFIDLGSGKGRAVITASQFSFRRIVGVEYSGKLCNFARQNVANLPDNNKRCHIIDIINADAAGFEIPEDPLVIFLYNPFGKQVMQHIVQNVSYSYHNHKRRIIVLYLNPLFAESWDKADFVHEIERTKEMVVFDSEG